MRHLFLKNGGHIYSILVEWAVFLYFRGSTGTDRNESTARLQLIYLKQCHTGSGCLLSEACGPLSGILLFGVSQNKALPVQAQKEEPHLGLNMRRMT